MHHLKRLLPYLRQHKKPVFWGIVCLVLTTVFSVASPWVLRYAIDDITRALTRQKLEIYAGLIIGLVIVEGFFRYHMRMILIGVSREIEYELRNDLFRHLTSLSPSYYQT